MANDDDDVLQTRQSHPEVTALLIIGCLSLIAAINLGVTQLGRYVNPESRRELNNFQIKAVTWAEEELDKNHKADLAGVKGEDGAGPVTPERDF